MQVLLLIIPIGFCIGFFGAPLYYWLAIDKRKHSYYEVLTCRDI